MLEVRNLVKIYKPKKGVPVRALDGVSLRFPEKGMVFLLGKSGSGKSTLLNLLGGLDRYNSGEILINGRSSRTFRQQHFDSYRNTYVGFIFQEYNILEEFSVGSNIALALQLQGKKPTTQAINGILEQVDLAGFGSRKPNELSGGQKQRVAIARALVKNPQIIMADEPTGALDSATGRQVLTTLKKLSRDKLVLVVSHDREFAEQYADRIVELADGRVIRDVEQVGENLSGEVLQPVFEESTIHVPMDYEFTPEDSRAITEHIQKAMLQGRELTVKLAAANSKHFVPTEEGRIPPHTGGFHLIRSRLPLHYAFKLGASGLKHKKFRLFMTILLCVVAFTLFGMADTMASYDYVTTSVSSLSHPEANVPYAAFEAHREVVGYAGSIYYEYDSFSGPELAELEKRTGLTVYPVYTFGQSYSFSFYAHLPSAGFDGSVMEMHATDLFHTELTGLKGFIAADPQMLEDMGAELVAGSLPAPGSNEVVISTYVLETFRNRGYRDGLDSIWGEWEFAGQVPEGLDSGEVEIRTAEDMIGKPLVLDGKLFIVSGVVETGMDFSRYDKIAELAEDDSSFLNTLLCAALYREWEYATTYSLTGLAIVDEAAIYALSQQYRYCEFGKPDGGAYMTLLCRSLSEVDTQNIHWLDGEPRQQLAQDELILTIGALDYSLDLGNGDLSQLAPFDVEILASNTMQSLGYKKVVGIYMDANWDNTFGVFADSALADMGFAWPGSGSLPSVAQTLSPMPTDPDEIRTLVALSDKPYTNEAGVRTQVLLQNPVSFELRELKDVFEGLKIVFFWIGLVMMIFASLLFSNFIGTSISYKKRQIGILRALGSRSNDVFRIFFAESFIIAMINFAISLTGTVILSALVNYFIRYSAGLLLTVLNVGLRQVALLFGVCLGVAFMASFLPVRRIAAKRPVDAILDR